MIVAVTNQNDHAACHAVAASLAGLRASAGRSVLLVDACACVVGAGAARLDPGRPARLACGRRLPTEFDGLAADYHDIVIDTDGADPGDCHAALIAARVAIVPLRAEPALLERQYPLIARLNVARMFNPGLRVLFVVVGDDGDPSAADLLAVRAYVAEVMAGALASTVLHAGGGTADEADMQALYGIVFAH